VATGSRQAEKNAQETALKERMTAILKKFNKQMDTAAFRALYEKTGFNMRSFCASVEKMIDYVGERPRIQAADVEKALSRTRQDPIFELTSAVAERHPEAALFFLRSMLTGDLHPLQIIAALTNQVRKLIVAREFIDSPKGRAWRPKMPYSDFRRNVMPAVAAYDDDFRAMLSAWEDALAAPLPGKEKNGRSASTKKGKKKARKKKKPTGNQLLLAPNPNSPYPVFKTIENASRFTLAELVRALEKLYATDLRLKTGEKNPEVVLDGLVMEICRQEQKK
jgi:DNA polymerase-3 subunit delta